MYRPLFRTRTTHRTRAQGDSAISLRRRPLPPISGTDPKNRISMVINLAEAKMRGSTDRTPPCQGVVPPGWVNGCVFESFHLKIDRMMKIWILDTRT